MMKRVHDVVIKEARQNQELSKKQDFKPKIVSTPEKAHGHRGSGMSLGMCCVDLVFIFLWALFKTGSKVLESS